MRRLHSEAVRQVRILRCGSQAILETEYGFDIDHITKSSLQWNVIRLEKFNGMVLPVNGI